MLATLTAALDAVLATPMTCATDRLILADYLEETFGLDAGGLRRASERHPRLEGRRPEESQQ